jgi:protein involved in ribonucleotide reduction
VHNLADAAVRRRDVEAPWVLLTPSYKAGNADEVTLPAPVKAFLRSPSNRRRLVGIIGSGNRNFGAYYQAAARGLAAASGRPVLFEFELSGTPRTSPRARASSMSWMPRWRGGPDGRAFRA